MFKNKKQSSPPPKPAPVTIPICTSGSDAKKGIRPSMEDEHVHFDNVTEKFKLPSEMTHAFYGVYDGHGGVKAASLAGKYFHECLLKSSALRKSDITDDGMKEAIKTAFKRTDAVILQRSKVEWNWGDGCTAAICYVRDRKIYVGNLGDAEAVIGRRTDEGVKAECITFRHKPSSDEEKARIEAAGAYVLMGRVNGALAVSRALGDADFKMPRNGRDENFVSNDPYLNIVEIGPDVEFLVIACDGLWDVASYQQVADKIAKLKGEGKGPEETAQALTNMALELRSSDNVSAVVVYFGWEAPSEE